MAETVNLIEDGYTKRGHIKAEPGIHEGIHFEFRPMLAEQAEDLELIIKKSQGASAVRATSKVLCDHLVSWSEVDAKDRKPKPINEANVLKLPRELMVHMRHIIQGVWPGDPPDSPTPEENSEYYKSLLAHAEGKAPGLDQLESDRKN